VSTEQKTAAEQRAAQLSELLAQKDARMQHLRQRPLPTWLASRRNRRAMALLPAVPLIGGMYAGTMPDSMARATLMVVVVAVICGGGLLLRRVSRLLDVAPDRLLDEREAGERDDAYRRAHNLVVGLLALLALMAIADGTMRKVADSPLVDGDGWISITVTAVLVGTMMPAAVLAWRRSDPLDDIDD